MAEIAPVLQQTLQDALKVCGVGIHSGRPVRMFLRPAAANSGIRFRRIDLPGRPEIPATIDHVTRTTLATTIGSGGVEVHTIEHVMSALFGLGVDNVVIEIDGPEVPIFDGSAGPFVRLLREVGTVLLPLERHVFLPGRPVRVEEGDKWIEIEPDEHLSIDFTLDYPDTVIGRQRLVYKHSPKRYEVEIAHARTFGFAHEVEQLRAAGFAHGGALDNAVVVGSDSVLNPEGLRYPDEFVRHKILDLIGDIGLIGGPIVGRIRAHKSGHTLNRRFVRALIEGGLVERSPLSDVGRRVRENYEQHIHVIAC